MGTIEIRDWNLFSSNIISFKLDYDLDLNKVCSNFKSKSRSSMFFTPSLGNDRFLSTKETESTILSFLLCKSLSGLDIDAKGFGSRFLLV
jgi:hypothetical protein